MTGYTPGDNDTPPPSSASGFSDATSWSGAPPTEAPPTPPAGLPSPAGDGTQAPHDGYTQPQTGYTQPQTGYTQPQTGYAQPQDGYAQPYGGFAQPQDGYAQGQGYAQPYGAHPPAYGYGPPASQQTNGLAIAALVVSCVAVAGLCGWGLGGLLGIVGATLGHVARRNISRSGEGGAGLALAGIIIGWVSTAIAVIVVAGILWLAVDGGSFGP